MRRSIVPLCLLGVAAALAVVPGGAAVAGGGCHTGPTEGSGNTVELVKACFTPSILRVEPGTEVTFVSQDPMPHNISASAWGTDRDMVAGDTFTAMFRAEGVYPYACMYHFGMVGAIVVGDGKGAATIPVEVGTVSDALAEIEQIPDAEVELPSLETDADEPSVDPTVATEDVLGWALPGMVGALVGGGAAVAVRRRRRTA